MSLRARLMVAFGYLLLLAVVALSAPLAVNVAARARTDFAVALTNRADEVAQAAPAAAAGGMNDLLGLVQDKDDVARVVVTDARGRLLADSTGQRPVGFDYTFRREIRAALRGQTTRLVRTHALGEPHYVVAVPLISGRRVTGAVRLDRSVAAVEAQVRTRLLAMVGVSLAVLAVGLGVAAGLAGSLTRPLRRLAAAAVRIGEGDLDPHVAAEAQPEVAEVAAALNGMAGRIGQTLRTQSDFLANASHQLRTPLTGLRLRLESLLNSEARGTAQAAIAETDRLNRIVEDLLLLVRAGTHPERRASFDATQALESAFDRWSVQAAEDDHVLRISSPPVPLELAADASDVAMILDNLIENAIKYTPTGTTVTMTADHRAEGGSLTVSDDGPGVSPTERELIFHRFFRGSSTRDQEGTGLGLAIVEEVAKRWGGAVTLDDVAGTSITVLLPLAASTGATATTTASLSR